MSLNAKVKDGTVYFNAIPATSIFEAKDKEGNLVKDSKGNQRYNIYLNVPREFSRKGDVLISSSYVNDDKFEEGAKSVSFPADYKINVRVYSFYNENDKDKNKFEDIEITAGELATKVQEYAESKKVKTAEVEAEVDEPEMD